jgi:chromosome partitioning protein
MPIITVANQKGGVGKTTIALNLSIEMQVAAIVDLDPMRLLSKINLVRDVKALPLLPIAQEANKESLIRLAKEFNSSSKLAVVDTHGYDGDLARYAVGIADLVLIPCDDSALELWGTREFLKIINEMQITLKRSIVIRGVFNKLNPSTKNLKESETLLERGGLRMLKSVIRMRGGIKAAIAEGKAACEYAAAFASRDEIAAVAEEILQTIKKETSNNG